MAASLRRRLIAVAAVAAIACAGALAAILYLVKTGEQERLARADETVAREVERLARALETVPVEARPRHGKHGFGELRSGWVVDPAHVDRGSPNVATGVRASAERGDLVVLDLPWSSDIPVAVAAIPAPGGGYVWAAQRVMTWRRAKALRWAVLALAITSLGLVGVSLGTVVTVERSVASLK